MFSLDSTCTVSPKDMHTFCALLLLDRFNADLLRYIRRRMNN